METITQQIENGLMIAFALITALIFITAIMGCCGVVGAGILFIYSVFAFVTTMSLTIFFE